MGYSEKTRQTGKNFQNISKTNNNRQKVSDQIKSSKNKIRDLITITDEFFGRRIDIIFLISLILTIILGIYLFDVKISEGGDDSDYILSAKKFLDGRQFPYWHGSFYPIFLSLLLLIFGFNIIIFKIFSFLFIILHLVFFYYALKKRVSATLLSLVLIITAVNSNLLYYASQTYSEAIYLFLQAVLLYVFLSINDHLDKKPYKLAEHWKSWLLFGFLALIISTTRNVGYSILIAVILYLLIYKKYIATLYAFVSYLVFTIPYNIYKWLVWDLIPGKSGGGRVDLIFYKNPYNKAAGTEDFIGMVTRFTENSKIYLSKHFFIITGLKDPNSTETSVFLTILMYALFFIVLIYTFKKSKALFFVSLYLAFSIGITFITLQQSWGQQRLILVYVPIILLLLSWGINQLFFSNNRILLFIISLFIGVILLYIYPSLFTKVVSFLLAVSSIALLKYKKIIIVIIYLQISLFAFLIIIANRTIGITGEKIELNKKVLSKNIKGNLYYGFTPDWINFLKMSEWVGKNIPDNIVVASRKPSMSFIYSKGKEFYPIYRLPLENGDTLINKLKGKYNNLCVIENKQFNIKKIPIPIQMNFKRTNLAFVGLDNEIYGVYDVRENYKESFYNTLDFYKVDYIQKVDSFMVQMHKSNKQYFGISPDSLLNILKNNNVDYVIMGSLRVNPNMKTTRTINTIQRFLYFIELKYPGIFSLVLRIGKQDEEPAYLYKVNYNKYNIGN